MKPQMCRQCRSRPARFVWRDTRGVRHFGRGHAHDLCRQCWDSAMAALRSRLVRGTLLARRVMQVQEVSR